MKILLLFGVQAGQMTKLEPTALVVNLRGRAAPSGSPRCVAFRADMDALTMNEKNPELDYRSQVQGKAHMCGHDGHVACLVAFVPRFLDLIDRVPSDKVVRLLFQPSEEGPESGAKKMIEQGCL